MVRVEVKPGAKLLGDPNEPGATLWIGLGLGSLGFVAGFTTALSVEGVSAALLTGMFSFVAGTLLTFGGFRFMKGNRMLVSTRRAGIGVFSFAIGILLGEPSGIAARMLGTGWLQSIAEPPMRAGDAAEANRSVEHAIIAARCSDIRERLETDAWARNDREFEDLRFLWERSDCRADRR